jgi:hypothetical protein
VGLARQRESEGSTRVASRARAGRLMGLKGERWREGGRGGRGMGRISAQQEGGSFPFFFFLFSKSHFHFCSFFFEQII